MSTAPNLDPFPPDVHPDTLTRRVTSFASFGELVNAPGYVPTLAGEDLDELELANLYDAAQMARGDARRAYRGTVRA